MSEETDVLLEAHHQIAQDRFWEEKPKEFIMSAMEAAFSAKVLRLWLISDITFNNGTALIKWERRIRPLTDEELKEEYGK